MTRTVGAIDIGSNTALLTVTQLRPDGSVARLVDRATICGLGGGLDRGGVLGKDGIERTLATLRDYVKLARSAGATRVRAVGTAALREARNPELFLAPAEEILGTPVEVVSERREAELAFAGALAGLGLGSGPCTLLDVGGRSTEFARGTGDGRCQQTASLPVGAVKLQERHRLGAPATAAQLAALETDLDLQLAELKLHLSAPLIGTAGTVTTLAAIAFEVEPYHGDRIHGRRLERREIGVLKRRLANMTRPERELVRGLEPARADVIVAGAAIVERVCKTQSISEVIVSDGGVRIGLAIEILSEFCD